MGKNILEKYNLFHAKVPLSDAPRPRPGHGFVLCIYDASPRFKDELKKYADEKTITYKHWKRDSETMKEKNKELV